MKKLILFLLLSVAAHANTTVTGTIIDPTTGNKFNGTMSFILSYNGARQISTNSILVTPIPPPAISVNNGSLPTGFTIPGNDDIAPARTTYMAYWYDQSGALLRASPYYISGGTFDLGSAVPTAITTSNVNFLDLFGLRSLVISKSGGFISLWNGLHFNGYSDAGVTQTWDLNSSNGALTFGFLFPKSFLVSTLPAASGLTNALVVVTDALTQDNCGIGGGSSLTLCRSNGTTWVSFLSSGSYVTVNGNQTINNVKTFTSVPVIPGYVDIVSSQAIGGTKSFSDPVNINGALTVNGAGLFNNTLTVGSGISLTNGFGVTTPASTGNTFDISLSTGNSTTSGTTGNLAVTVGTATSGGGGSVNLNAGNSSALGSGGNITMQAGAAVSSGGAGTGRGGSITGNAGNNSVSGRQAGSISFLAGHNSTSSNQDGSITISTPNNSIVLNNTSLCSACVQVTGTLSLTATTFALLPGSPQNGMWLYCSDCTVATPTAGGGTGAFVGRRNGVWVGY